MCWATLLVHKCSLPSCLSPALAFKQTIALTPCYHRPNLGKHLLWPGGCSVCTDDSGKVNDQPHVTPFDHHIVEESALVARRSICPVCRKVEGIRELQTSRSCKYEGPQKEFLQPQGFSKVFCTILKVRDPRTIDLVGAIADALEPIRLAKGLAPHPFIAGCIYAASHLAPCPEPIAIERLIKTFNLKSRVWFLHAYTSLFENRYLIAEAGAVRHAAVLAALPKPCCQRPQVRHCPRVKNKWGFEEDKCTGRQVDGPHAAGAYVGFLNWLQNLGVPVMVPGQEYYSEDDWETTRTEKTPGQLEKPVMVQPLKS